MPDTAQRHEYQIFRIFIHILSSPSAAWKHLYNTKDTLCENMTARSSGQTDTSWSCKSDWFSFSTFTSGACAIVWSAVFSWPTEITLHMKLELTKMLSGTFKMVFKRDFIVQLKLQTHRDSDERLQNTFDWSMLLQSWTIVRIKHLWDGECSITEF